MSKYQNPVFKLVKEKNLNLLQIEYLVESNRLLILAQNRRSLWEIN